MNSWTEAVLNQPPQDLDPQTLDFVLVTRFKKLLIRVLGRVGTAAGKLPGGLRTEPRFLREH